VPTLMAHCFLGHSGAWGAMAEALGPLIDALAFDMPGHGRTPMPEQIGDLQADVAGQIDGFVAVPSLLIGHSFGAASALRFALRHPERVLGMVLIEPVFIAAALADPDYTPAPHNDADYSILARTDRLEEAARSFFAYNDASRDWDALPAPARAMMTAQMRLLPATEPGIIDDSGDLLAPGLMEAFEPSVLLIGGDRSPEIFPAIIKALAKRLPHVKSEVIAGAGHMVPMTHPQETADRIAQWMDAHGLRPEG